MPAKSRLAADLTVESVRRSVTRTAGIAGTPSRLRSKLSLRRAVTVSSLPASMAAHFEHWVAGLCEAVGCVIYAAEKLRNSSPAMYSALDIGLRTHPTRGGVWHPSNRSRATGRGRGLTYRMGRPRSAGSGLALGQTGACPSTWNPPREKSALESLAGCIIRGSWRQIGNL